MIHTLPDYTTKYKLTKVFSSVDINELAARLGSIDTYDRRGNVLWWDDFNETVNKWLVLYGGGDGTWAVDTAQPHWTKQCGKLTTDPGAASYAEIYKRLFYPVNSIIAGEWLFAIGEKTSSIDIIIYNEFDGIAKAANLRLNVADSKFQMYNLDIHDYEDLPGGSYLFQNDLSFYYPLKLSIDLANNKYKTLLFAGETYDLSDYSLTDIASLGFDYVECGLMLTTVGGGAAVLYINGFIATYYE